MNDRPLREEGIVLDPLKPVFNKQDGECHSKSPDQFILNWFDHFHKWDFITAEATEGKPKWITIKKFPLSPETLYGRWQSSSELVGVRFKSGCEGTTSYALVDIDIGSQYHPRQDPSAIAAITRALETIGIYQHVKVRSSFSGGLHLYFPLADNFNCYKLAVALQQTLERLGLQIQPGQLEIFPNVKAPRSNYQAHRLPLQLGSFVLDSDFQPVYNSLPRFIQTWNTVAEQQDLTRLTEVVAEATQTRLSCSKDLEEWERRLEASLAKGFTKKGQTNQLIKEVCIYLRVFKELKWDEVAIEAYGVITSLPGYQEYCGHRQEIKKRIQDWVKTNQESNRYYPASNRLKVVQKRPKAPSNEVRSENAIERIKQAIAYLTESGTLPSGVKARQVEICKIARCSASTLRKYNELWHPDFQIKGCVTTDLARLSTILATSEEQVSPANHVVPTCLAPLLGCVTTGGSTVSTDTATVSKNEKIAGIQVNQTVTHPPLLSVGGVCGSEETILSNNRTDQLILDHTHKRSVKFPIGSIVKKQGEQELLRITAINLDGTYWAKWLNATVPRVSILLRENEIELIDNTSISQS